MCCVISQETFWVCIPTFASRKPLPENTVEYNVHMPVCFFCLPNCCAEGCCTCRIPFYIYTPENDNEHVGKIVKIWAGLGNELLGVHQYEVEFPPGANEEAKARLVGAMFLINELFFRKNDDKEQG